MNSRNLKVLVAATIALVLVLLVMQSGERSGGSVNEALLPGLIDDINDADSLTVVRAAETTVIRRTDAGWVNESRGNYPADVGKIRELLLEIANAKTLEEKTSNPEYYDRLGVDDPAGNADSKATRLTIGGNGIDYDLVLGNVAQPGTRYVRRFDDAGSWLIDADPTVPANAAAWLVKDVVDLKADEIRSVTIVHPDGETIRVSKASAEQTDFDVEDLPADRELSYPTVANGIGGVLNALQFDDVRAGSGFDGDTVKTTFETFAGDTIDVTVSDENGSHWIAFAVTAGANGAEADAESAGDSIVEALASRTDGWQYQVASYKANQLVRRWDDILKDLPDPEADEE